MVGDERHDVGEAEEPAGFHEHHLPGVQLAADDRQSCEAGDREQAEQHDAEALQRGVDRRQLFAQRNGFLICFTFRVENAEL